MRSFRSPLFGLYAILPMLLAGAAVAQNIQTAAGGGPDNMPAVSANLGGPRGVAVDARGNLFIASGSRVYKVDVSGLLTVVAGNGIFGFSGDGGQARSAALRGPQGIALDAADNLYIADVFNNRVRRVDGATGIISTVAGNGLGGFNGDDMPATSASLNGPTDVGVDAAGNLFIADRFNHRIRRVDAQTGSMTTAAGSSVGGSAGDGGLATNANLRGPEGLVVTADGGLFITDNGNLRVRHVDPTTGIIMTVAGNGTCCFSADGILATDASFSSLPDVAVDAAGNLFLAERSSHRIRRVDASTGILSTIAGTGTAGFAGDGELATNARLELPSGVAVDIFGNVFIADTNNRRIRRVDFSTGVITTVAGGGVAETSGDGFPATDVSLGCPTDVALSRTGQWFIADACGGRIRRVNVTTGLISTVAGDGFRGFSGDGGLAIDARLNVPQGMDVDATGNLFIADTDNQRIRRVDSVTGIISTIAGTGLRGFFGDGGPATNARLRSPWDVTVDNVGNLYIADRFNHRIRRVDTATGIITTVAGNGGTFFNGDNIQATMAAFEPISVFVDGADNLLIADLVNGRIRRVDAISGIITTVAGNGGFGFNGDHILAVDASLSFPAGIVADEAGDMFIADNGNNRIRRVDAASGIITTVAGDGSFGFHGDGGLAIEAGLANPRGIDVNSTGSHFFIADGSNRRVRRVGRESGSQPPTALCTDLVLFASDECLADASVDGGSFDPDGGPITITQLPPGPYSLGLTVVTLVVTDDQGAENSCMTTILVRDTTPPDLQVAVTPVALWPPDHRMVDIDVLVTATDNCGSPAVELIAVESNEDADNDIQGAAIGTPDNQFKLRAERMGAGDGRLYSATYRAVDSSGNSATATAFISVPHDQGGMVQSTSRVLTGLK